MDLSLLYIILNDWKWHFHASRRALGSGKTFLDVCSLSLSFSASLSFLEDNEMRLLEITCLCSALLRLWRSAESSALTNCMEESGRRWTGAHTAELEFGADEIFILGLLVGRPGSLGSLRPGDTGPQ